jgi:hypothetical protein
MTETPRRDWEVDTGPRNIHRALMNSFSYGFALNCATLRMAHENLNIKIHTGLRKLPISASMPKILRMNLDVFTAS